MVMVSLHSNKPSPQSLRGDGKKQTGLAQEQQPGVYNLIHKQVAERLHWILTHDFENLKAPQHIYFLQQERTS